LLFENLNSQELKKIFQKGEREMKKLMVVLGMLVLVVLSGCGKSTEKAIIGKWKEVDSTETIEFFKDGTVTVIDKGMSMSGNYKFVGKNRIKMELGGLGALMGPIVSKISISGNELSMTMPDGKIERYQRLKKSSSIEKKRKVFNRRREKKTKEQTQVLKPMPEKKAPFFEVKFSWGKFRIGDFSVALNYLDREPSKANLYFAITKVKHTGSEIGPVAITLTDDHENNYYGSLNITPCDDFPIRLLPKNFAWIRKVSITMPKAAPIERIQLEDGKKIAFKKLKIVKLRFKSDFGKALLRPGKSAPVGKFLFFTTNGIIPDLYTWALSVTVENKEYNELRADVKCAIQFTDGTISSLGLPVSVAIPGLSKKTVQIKLRSLQDRKVPQLKTLLIFYRDYNSGQTTLKLWPISDKNLPPRVGQGAKEEIFIDAYQRNGGRERMENPVELPRWYVGVIRPKDEQDLLIQRFPKAIIVWDKQHYASRAYVLKGPILKKYIELGGPYHCSESQKALFLGAPTSELKPCKSAFGTKGNFVAFKGGAIFLQNNRTFVLMGKIGQKWDEQEDALGFPISDIQPTVSDVLGSDNKGWVQEFEGGYIYYITKGEQVGQVFGISGTIAKIYSKASWLGLPISDTYSSPETGHDQCDFEKGYIASSDGKTFQVFHYEPGVIAFVSDRDGNKEIYLTDASGRKQTNFTNNPSDDWCPAWSPDGKKIAFVSNRGGKEGIYLMNVDGNDQRFLTAGKEPSWFPDGEKIIFSKPMTFIRKIVWETKKESLKRIFAIKIDGTEIRQISPDASTAEIDDFKWLLRRHFVAPVVSPDGSKIAFAGGDWGSGHPYSINLMNIDGKHVESLSKRLGEKSQSGANPSWSPDGTRIAFRCDRGYDGPIGNVGRIHIADLKKSLISDPYLKVIWRCSGLDWSSDGSSLVFSGYKETGYTYTGTVDIYIVRPGLKVIRKITKGQGNNYDPSWTTGKQEGKTKIVSKKRSVPSEKISEISIPGKYILETVNSKGKRLSWEPGAMFLKKDGVVSAQYSGRWKIEGNLINFYEESKKVGKGKLSSIAIENWSVYDEPSWSANKIVPQNGATIIKQSSGENIVFSAYLSPQNNSFDLKLKEDGTFLMKGILKETWKIENGTFQIYRGGRKTDFSDGRIDGNNVVFKFEDGFLRLTRQD